MLRHQAGSFNCDADDLSRRTLLLTTMSTKVVGFETFTDKYTTDPSFGRIFQVATEGHRYDFALYNGYLFHGLQLCIPDYSLRTKLKQWDLALPQAKFAYKRSKNRTTDLSPFEIVYGQKPYGIIRDINTKYKSRVDSHRRHILFDVGDFVWVVLTRDRFPVGEYNKLKDRKIGSYEVVPKINDNAYRLRLPSHLKTSDVFNVKRLSPCFVDSDDTTLNLRTSSFQPGVNDAGGSETDDVELSDCTLMALRYHELADQRKGGS
ncbi:hypothetical protein F3Y22_tig00002511pilonHSYRG00030 [Hibiscus syriacus]|uniref:Tf2-1-like SH3-like domain-containing protein n=1 Tax=Hibiscus syriacus TaxID=106335 RepID=A0A6A3CX58_HIBSY|nr:hypothetical protein F3Y22_tig00002511pilonHSYRG00030 [Hibiscus syriacus]